ncbi:hypothetical protein [Pedobacter sp. V48]|uniref:hypothetical protein n=1 Tax=Pedobacter sp. V48 TaxID=509635 RepID=UPI0012686F12|nr:hypothetical protein [Pedobacter sp. V48]
MKEIKNWAFDTVHALNGFALGCLALILMLGSCGRSPEFAITGTYVNHESGEYSISKDTLLILAATGDGNYQLIRRSAFQRIREGKLQPEEMKVRNFTGRFDPQKAILVLDGEDKQVRFFSGGKSLLLAKREYQKVNNL